MNETFSFHLMDFIRMYWKWRWKILGITILGAGAGVLFSSPFFITPMFKSNMIFYPTVTNSVSAAFLKEQSGSKSDPLEFGAEIQVEQMLQVLNSDMMKAAAIQKFNLMAHYGINQNDNFKNLKLSKEYDRNVSFKRTEFTSIECIVRDHDPAFAAKMIDGIADIIDSLKTQIQRTVAVQALHIVEKAYLDKVYEVSAINDSLQKLSNMGIYSFKDQASTLTDRLSKGGYNATEVKVQQELLAKYGQAYETLSRTRFLEQEKLSDLKKMYDAVRVDAEANLTHKFIVSKSGQAEFKSYPIRWLITFLSAISALGFAVVFIFFLEKIIRPFSKNQPSGEVPTR